MFINNDAYITTQTTFLANCSYHNIFPAADLVLYEVENSGSMERQRKSAASSHNTSNSFSLVLLVDR